MPDVELVKRAKQLGLPENFYNYLDTPEPESDGETFPWERVGSTMPVPVIEAEKPVEEEKKGGFAFNFNTNAGKSTFGSIAPT